MFARARLLLFAVLLLALTGVALADVFEPGDIVIPGNRIVDSWGNVHGCIYRLRNGVITRVFEFPKMRLPSDMIIDSQGRLVIAALQNGANANETALFRIDPASGTFQRLTRFPYIVAAGDTIPSDLHDATGFYGFSQSLHLEKEFAIEINDDENGGWPQVSQPENYGFSIGASSNSGPLLKAFRWRNDNNEWELGTDVSLLSPWTGAPYMAADDDFIYYGMNSVIGRTRPVAHLSVHLDGDWGTFDASATIPPKNEIIIGDGHFDNTFVPNGTVQCGPNIDTNVPFSTVGGCCFAVLSMNGIGVLDGTLFATSNSGATGVPYVFSLAGRDPYLNPYICLYIPASQGHGPIPFNMPEDGTPTAARWTTPDGGGILGIDPGVLHRVTPTGDHTILRSASGDEQFTGRPWRWPGAGRQVASKAAPGSQLLVLRADALVHVLLTDGLGRRLGFDAVGDVVNDFGASGQVLSGAGGWPKLVMLRDPELGITTVDVHPTAAGDWSVKGYLAHESAGGTSTTTIGSSTDVETVESVLFIGKPLVLSWHQSPAGVELPETDRASFVAGPVPSQGEIRFAFRAPDAGAKVELAVFDLRGARVARPITTTFLAGPQHLDWSGRDSEGRRLAHGVYIARLSIDGQQHMHRIVLMR